MKRKIWIVEEQGFYGEGGRKETKEFHTLAHICATEELAKKRLEEWIKKHKPYPEDIERTGATCYFEEVPWKTVDSVEFEKFRVPGKALTENDGYGSVEACIYYEFYMEE